MSALPFPLPRQPARPLNATCSKCGAATAPDAIFCSRCGLNFTLEQSAMRLTPAGTDVVPVPEGTDPALQRLVLLLSGRYQVTRQLGRGGMATVYLATDVKHDREVAIKVLLPELAASIGADRFEREIRLAAKLQHPHILGLYDSGVADGLLYYVMPFVKGESLRDRLDRERQLPIEDAIGIALEVASALGHAHEQGIVHRDIKPENILLQGGHALVADFGIARAASEAGQQKLTQTGMAVGTPVYMSPEQSMGEVVGPTADLYSLGCVLYEMLAGEPPFMGPNAVAIMARHAMEQVPSVRIVRNTVPDEVEEAIFRVLEKSPADRPQTAAAFSELLGTPLGTTSTMRVRGTAAMRRPTATYATPESLPAPTPVPLWRRPAVLVGAALLLAAGVGGAWFARGERRATADLGPEARRLAVLYFTDVSRDSSLAPLADGLTEELIRSLSTAPTLTVISRTGVEKFRGADVPADSVARALRAGYLVRGEVEPDGDSIRVNIRLDDGNGATLRRAAFAGPSANQLALVDTIAVVAADIIRQELGQELQLKERRGRTESREAWLLAQRGEQAWKGAEAALRGGDEAAVVTQFAAADSLLAAAAATDRRWSEPMARRAALAYRQARLAPDEGEIGRWVGRGIEIADSALAVDGDDPDALEARGSLRYFGWLSNLDTDPARRAAAIAAARADLEKATAINRAQAGAYAMLSHLYNNVTDATSSDVLIAAQRAYETDEFLTNANVILSRMFIANYDLGQFDKAAQWCDEARRRFPKDPRSLRCRLYLLTSKVRTPDVPTAWAIADSAVALAPPAGRESERRYEDMLVAAVVARAAKAGQPALADSARRVVKRSLGDAQADPTRELAYYASFVHAILGDADETVRLLKQYLAANPQKMESFRSDPGWWYRDLASDPRFKALIGAQ